MIDTFGLECVTHLGERQHVGRPEHARGAADPGADSCARRPPYGAADHGAAGCTTNSSDNRGEALRYHGARGVAHPVQHSYRASVPRLEYRGILGRVLSSALLRGRLHVAAAALEPLPSGDPAELLEEITDSLGHLAAGCAHEARQGPAAPGRGALAPVDVTERAGQGARDLGRFEPEPLGLDHLPEGIRHHLELVGWHRVHPARRVRLTFGPARIHRALLAREAAAQGVPDLFVTAVDSQARLSE